MTTVHLLKANGAKEAPYADYALCGYPVDDGTPMGISAFWPGEKLVGGGKWCRECKAREKHALAHPLFSDGCDECLSDLDAALHEEWARQHRTANDGAGQMTPAGTTQTEPISVR